MTTSVKTGSNAFGQRAVSASSPERTRGDLVAELVEQMLGELADLVIVLDQQDPAGRGGFERAVLAPRAPARLGAPLQRQQQGDRRALAGRAVDADVAARLAGEAIDLAEAEAGALAGRSWW